MFLYFVLLEQLLFNRIRLRSGILRSLKQSRGSLAYRTKFRKSRFTTCTDIKDANVKVLWNIEETVVVDSKAVNTAVYRDAVVCAAGW